MTGPWGMTNMVVSPQLKLALTELVTALAEHAYERIVIRQWMGRVNAADLDRVIAKYGATLVRPPDNFIDLSDVFPLSDGSGVVIDIPLWTQEEGRSDLTISVLVTLPYETISINDLRVP